MATSAEMLAVRKESQLYGFEFFNNTSGVKLELIKQQPPITVISVLKNSSTLTADTDYAFDNFRTITLTTAAVEADVYRVEVGFAITNDEIGTIIDFAKEELYSDLRSYYNDSSLDNSSYITDLYLKLASGYLLMRFFEGSSNREDLWKYGRNWVDSAHKRCDEIRSGRIQLVDASNNRVAKDVSPFQYEILEHAKGLFPSGLYSETAEDLDDEIY